MHIFEWSENIQIQHMYLNQIKIILLRQVYLTKKIYLNNGVFRVVADRKYSGN